MTDNPQRCDRCDRLFRDTGRSVSTLAGEHICRQCHDQAEREAERGSREATQEGLDEFATDGGRDPFPTTRFQSEMEWYRDVEPRTTECWRCGNQRYEFESCHHCGASCKPLTRRKQQRGGDLRTDGGQAFYSGDSHILYDEPPDPDPAHACIECGKEALNACGCCHAPLCGMHNEVQAGFCSNFTWVSDVPLCVVFPESEHPSVIVYEWALARDTIDVLVDDAVFPNRSEAIREGVRRTLRDYHDDHDEEARWPWQRG